MSTDTTTTRRTFATRHEAIDYAETADRAVDVWEVHDTAGRWYLAGPADSSPSDYGFDADASVEAIYFGVHPSHRDAVNDEPYPYCVHGTYVGGCGVDWMCGACESGYEITPEERAVHEAAIRRWHRKTKAERFDSLPDSVLDGRY
jgi:hypothetical protein